MELTKGQEQGLQIAVDRFRKNKPYTVIAGYAGTGKAQPVDTLIHTPNGTKLLGEIKVGDYVFDRLGNPTKVLGVYPQGLLDCYKVTLADGRETYCNDQHLWSYCGRKIKNKNKFYTKSLREIMDDENFCYKQKHSNSCVYKYHIPTSHAIEYEEKKYDIDPYVIGVFLGDGCCLSKYLTLSSSDEDIVSEVAKLIGASGYKKNSDYNYNWSFDLPEHHCDNKNNKQRHPFKTNDLFKNYPTICDYSYNKNIPVEYMNGSINQRLALIQGLMDTDGSIRKAGGRYNVSFTSTSINLIKSVQTVLFSLGFSSSIHEDKRSTKYSNGISYNLHIFIPHSDKYKLFRLQRKRDIALEAKDKKVHRDYSCVSIVDIQKCDYRKEMVCIYVDNSEHLYLTNDYIVTHNTTLVQFIIKELKVKDDDVVFVSYTGKAALVLKNKGCPNAMTAHKLLYFSDENPDGTFTHTPRKRLERKYKLIVCDEASMLPQEMIDLLLSHNIHVLFLGDNEQLPPIDSDQTILNEPHVFLNEITRQAFDNPIIKLSMDIRSGQSLVYGGDKRCRVIPRSKVTDGLLLGADEIIVGKNVTRHKMNEYLRKLKWGDDYTVDPIDGEKCICLKNNWNTVGSNLDPLINGQIGILQNVKVMELKPYGKIIYADFLSDDGGLYKDLMIDYKLMVEGISTITPENWRDFVRYPKPFQFSYAYAITCHKSQGSEFDRVIVYDEAFGDIEQKKRWRYTAITRAAKQLVIVV